MSCLHDQIYTQEKRLKEIVLEKVATELAKKQLKEIISPINKTK